MAKRVRIDAADAADKWARRTTAATDDMRKGIERVTEAPGKLAAAKKTKMRQNVIAAIDSGKWERRVAAVSLEDWKHMASEIGVGRVSSGVEAAKAKQVDFYADLINYENTLLGVIDGMPDLTIDDMANRAVRWIKGMSKYERK